MTLVRTLYLILTLILPLVSIGQKKYNISFENGSYEQLLKRPKVQFKDSVEARAYVKELRKLAISKGYSLASIDTVVYGNHSARVTFFLGPKFGHVHLKLSSEEMEFIRKRSSLNEKFISNLPFQPKELSRTIEKIQSVYLNNGFPFVSIRLDEIDFDSTSLQAEMYIARGNLYHFDKINVRGDSSISDKYISNLINIRQGDLYNEFEITQISQRVQQVPFIKEIKPAELLFTKDGVELFLYLERIPVSSANGIIGFQPNPTTKKLSITGEIDLKLLDALRRGELLDVRWQSIRDQTQSLKSRLNYPFLFNTPFGIDGTFDLYKRDTSFLELNFTAGVQYFLNRGSYLKAFYHNASSNVLSGGANNPLFSNLGSTKSNNYGLSFTSSHVDYIPNPTKGMNLLVEGSIGSRNSRITDSAEVVKSTVYRGKVELEFFVPLHKRHILRLSSTTEFYAADEIYENEVYRYGGLNSQRGFNEDELFATTKTTGTIEYRFLLDKNSHVFAFYDQSWYENNTNTYYNDSPLGFGLGFSFSTNFGVFSISYALGKQLTNPILFSNSKVHFGYIVYF